MKRLAVWIIGLAVVAAGLFLARPEWLGYFFDKIFPSLIGTGVGAWLAFQVKRLQDKNDETKRQKTAGNFALFTLVQQVNDLLQTERALAEWRPEAMKSTRWIEMKSILGFSEMPALHAEDLGWLLETNDRNILGRLMAARNGYLSVHGLLEHRKQIKFRVDDHLEKEIQKAGLVLTGSKIPTDFLMEHLTERQIVELKQSTEDLLTFSSDVLHDQFEVMEDLHKALKKIWPKSVFVKLEPKEVLLKRHNLKLPYPSHVLDTSSHTDLKTPAIHRIEVN